MSCSDGKDVVIDVEERQQLMSVLVWCGLRQSVYDVKNILMLWRHDTCCDVTSSSSTGRGGDDVRHHVVSWQLQITIQSLCIQDFHPPRAVWFSWELFRLSMSIHSDTDCVPGGSKKWHPFPTTSI